jgi:integrase
MARTRSPAPRLRRHRGEGTIYEKTRTWKTSDGKARSRKFYVAAVSEGYVEEDGRKRRQRKFFTGATASEARAARDEYLRDKGKAIPQEAEQADLVTVGECAQRFLDHTKRTQRLTTWTSYESTIRVHILPRLGTEPVAALTRKKMEALYDLMERKVSTQVKARFHIVLNAMLNLAFNDGILEANPLKRLSETAPRYQSAPVEALTETQAKELLRAAKGHRLGALFVLALTTGMRQGELFALRWSDIDLDRRTLSVSLSAQEVNGIITFVPPKSKKGRRRITLSRIAADALVRRRSIAEKEPRRKLDLVFTSVTGLPLRKGYFTDHDWTEVRLAAGLPDSVTFHTLRHTAATLLLQENVHPLVVSQMLGHSKVAVTLDVYSHVIPSLQAGAASAFDKVLGPKAKHPSKRT